MNYILADEPGLRAQLLPFTFTRPVCAIRIGMLTIKEKWELELKSKTSVKTEDYLEGKFPLVLSSKEDNIWINGAVLPSPALVKAIKNLKKGERLVSGNMLIAVNSGKNKVDAFTSTDTNKYPIRGYKPGKDDMIIEHVWDIFSKNGDAIAHDYARLTKGKKSAKVPKTNILIGKNIFIEKGVKMECVVVNSDNGYIYIGKDAELMEGAVLKGSVAVCESSVVKIGAKIYGATTIGPHSKVAGEVNNAVIFGYSNKGHDGFLGNSVLGEWCNLGADTNNSNLKNNYSTVKVWSYVDRKEVSTGLMFCGLIMGDHSKCGINTMFNTGTVVGVSANIYGGDFPPKHIPSYSWGGSKGFVTYELDKAMETAQRVFERRHITFDKNDKLIMSRVFGLTEQDRVKS